jgi:TolB-like protein
LKAALRQLSYPLAQPPPRSVILDAELCEHARGEPVRVPLAGHGKLNDPLPDQLSHAISQADGQLKLGAHGFKRPVHGADLLGLESETTGSRSWHRGAAGVWSGAALRRTLAAVWEGRIVSEATLSSRINAVRGAVHDSGEEQRLIRTILRKGIRFVGAVREELVAEVAGAAMEGPNPCLALPDRPSIAVLPFVNMSGDPEQEYFADGMVEDIITGLSRVKWLFVISRNSSFIYKGKPTDVRVVGRELGVRYVLEGSVRRSSNRVRVTGKLTETETGVHAWADRYDGMLGDIFTLQDQMTMSVIGAVEPTLRKAEVERTRRKAMPRN